ncbi:activating signal cointegrator 1 complex subunit 1 [Clonorchis sinensis]|uniref:Activating signal cointegrator 1 complex subunit 1 n=2 Tax=Clonorchis sinensis TaxID=79923 RepID=G7YRG6_CLOSI|nr:activating signal cointegrator 1 complex subunit 1 [Clonorchis sinensis]
MDYVLYPKMLHTGSRHYRINPTRHELSQNLLIPVSQLDEDDLAGHPLADTEDILPNEFTETIEPDNEGFSVKLRIPTLFHGFIIGHKREKLKQLEQEFSCRVTFPLPGSPSSDITVKAISRASVAGACRRLLWIQTNARMRSNPTHFICLPANSPELQRNFVSFRQAALDFAASDTCGDFMGISTDVFKSPASLHFTIIPLLLADSSEVQLACDLMHSFSQSDIGKTVLSDGPFRLTIQGLEYMNDDPQKVKVLYAKIAPSADRDRLQRMSNDLTKLFQEHNLLGGKLHRPDGDVLLHLTLMYASDSSGSQSSSSAFSITGLLRELGDFTFAEDHCFDTLHLCLMGSQTGDEFYSSCCQLNFSDPSNPKLSLS